MDTLRDLGATLAAIPQQGLDGLRAAIDGSPGLPPGLLAWLEGTLDWEVNRRAGLSYRLQGPLAAIDDSEVEMSLAALAMLAGHFRASPLQEGAAIAPLFELSAAILRDEIDRADRPE